MTASKGGSPNLASCLKQQARRAPGFPVSCPGASLQRTVMLEDIKRLFAELRAGSKQSSHFDSDDYRVAAAALLVHVATLQGELTQAAREKLRSVLIAQFSLTDALTDELIQAAVAADREAVDFYHFTSLLMRNLNEQGRLRLREILW